MKKIILILCILSLTACGVRHTNVKSKAYVPSKCEFMNDRGDGSITVTAYGFGKDRFDGMAQAQKNAIREILLEGIQIPGDIQRSRPMVYELNKGEKQNSEFFRNFLKDGGDYTKFISTDQKKSGTTKTSHAATQLKVSTTVTILCEQLREYLRSQGQIQ